jgi:hypothetical protein
MRLAPGMIKFLRPRWLRLAVVALACASAVHGRLGDGGGGVAPLGAVVANASMGDEPVAMVVPPDTQGDTQGDTQEATATMGEEPAVVIVQESSEAPPTGVPSSTSAPSLTAAPVSSSNSTAGNATAGDATAGNATAGNATAGNATASAPPVPPLVVPLPVDAVSHETPAASQAAAPAAPQEVQQAPSQAPGAGGADARQILIIGGGVLGGVVLVAAAVAAGTRRRHRLPEPETQPAAQEPPAKKTFWGGKPKPDPNEPVFALSFHDPDVWSGLNDSFYPPPDDLVRAKRGDKDLKIVAPTSPRAAATFRRDGGSPRAVPAPPGAGSPRAEKPASPTGRALPPMPPRPGSPEALSAWKDKHTGAIKLAEKMFLADKFDSVRVRTGSGTLVEGEI